MADWGALFGKESAVQQLFMWSVLNQVLSALINPALTQLAQEVNEKVPELELSPADLADMVVRNFIGQADAAVRAARNGISADRFALLVDNAGNGIAPVEAATALRRGLIPETGKGASSLSFEQAIAEGDLKDKWAPIIRQLAEQWPTPIDALDALLKGQVSPSEGAALYQKFGGDPTYFKLLFDTRGSAPTPVQAADMARRGIIPWTGTGPDVVSFEQAFKEGPWRDKWLQPFERVSEYIPPPREITTLLKDNAISNSEAQKLLEQRGLTPQLAAAYIHSGHSTVTSSSKALTKAQILSLYQDGIITESEAVGQLTGLGESQADARLLLALEDYKREATALNGAVSRIKSLYIGGKISLTSAQNAVAQLGIDATQAKGMVEAWRVAASNNVKLLTESQIADAFEYQIMTQATATQQLVALGYSAYDAWVILSVKAKTPLPGEPAGAPLPPPPPPSAGTVA